MYNGIGLETARGSGTNGHVQRNWALVRKTKDRVNYRTEEEIAKLDSASNKQPNKEILDHERKRKIEVKCAELEDELQQQGLGAEEVEQRVVTFRAKISEAATTVARDEFGRIDVRETHQIAEAQQEKNARLRDAFGIPAHFVDGSSLDPARRARDEQAAKEAAADKRRYDLVRTPSHEREQDAHNGDAKRNKSRKSASPEVKKRKKKKSKKNKKEKNESSKKKKKRSKSTSSESSSSSDESEESEAESSGSEKRKRKRKKKASGKRDASSPEDTSRNGSPVKSKKKRIHSPEKDSRETHESREKNRDKRQNNDRERHKDDKQSNSKKDNRDRRQHPEEEEEISHRRERHRPSPVRNRNSGYNRRSHSPSDIRRRVRTPSPRQRKTRSRSPQQRRDRSRKSKDRSLDRRHDKAENVIRERAENTLKNPKNKNEKESPNRYHNDKSMRKSSEKDQHRENASRTQKSRRDRESPNKYNSSYPSRHSPQNQRSNKERDEGISHKNKRDKRSTDKRRDCSSEYEKSEKELEKGENTQKKGHKIRDSPTKHSDARYSRQSPTRPKSNREGDRGDNKNHRESHKRYYDVSSPRKSPEPSRSERDREHSKRISRGYKNSRDSITPKRSHSSSRTSKRDRDRDRDRSSPKHLKNKVSLSPMHDSVTRKHTNDRERTLSPGEDGMSKNKPHGDKDRDRIISPKSKGHRGRRSTSIEKESISAQSPRQVINSPSREADHKKNKKTVTPEPSISENTTKSKSPTRNNAPGKSSPNTPKEKTGDENLKKRSKTKSPSDKKTGGGESKVKRSVSAESRASTSSSLSYSPARRSPERYKEIIEKLPEKDKRKYIRSPSDLDRKKPDDKEKSRQAHSRTMPTVWLRVSSSDEEGPDDRYYRSDRYLTDEAELRELDRLRIQLTLRTRESLNRRRRMEEEASSSAQALTLEDSTTAQGVEQSLANVTKSESVSKAEVPLIPKQSTDTTESTVLSRASPEPMDISPSTSDQKEEEEPTKEIVTTEDSEPKKDKEPKAKSDEPSQKDSKEVRDKSRSRSLASRHSRDSTRSRSRDRRRSRSRSSRSYSSSSGRSRSSRSDSSYSRSSRSSSRSSRSSRSSHSSDSSRSPSPPRASHSRSPSIPRRAGSPSFLERRRITSARKRPIPYRRQSMSSGSSDSEYSSRASSPWTRSPTPELS